MQIRSITYFVDPGWPLKAEVFRQARRFFDQARPAIAAAGFEVQSLRLACPPFAQVLGEGNAARCPEYARQVEQAAGEVGIDYASLGPALPDGLEWYAQIPAMLAETQNCFASGSLTSQRHAVSLPAVRECAKVIAAAAQISPDGFGNLRFTALGNVRAGSPFFPAAYHAGGAPAFALATEAADLAVGALTGAGSLGAARARLLEAIQAAAAALSGAANRLAGQTGVRFEGIDFTLAPYPEVGRSFGTALERAGVSAAGLSGTLAAAAFLADALDRVSFPRTGFTGLMLPVLEDATLARRAAEGLLTVNELLLYSTVCGTGLDCIPLPGDTTREQLAAVLLDLAALSLRLEKPLTARLMPVPGKSAGEETSFAFSYFANSRILPLQAAPLSGPLAGDEEFDLFPRRGG